MGDIVNLRRARKARAKAEEAAKAEANRALHGRGKAAVSEAKAEAARRARRDRALDAARLEPPRPEGEAGSCAATASGDADRG